MRLRLPPPVWLIIDKLTQNGYEAYAVGGCVRECAGPLTGRLGYYYVSDPQTGKRTVLSYRGYRAGARYRNRPHLREGFEVTTYRIDGKYEGWPYPEGCDTPKPVGGLETPGFYDQCDGVSPAAGLVDKFGGMQDLQRHRIRCVGERTAFQ